MPPPHFPLRWESTGDQWWYASPIDWAAANGHYDLVWELLHLDTNLLIKLTSLRRIRRLETVWDDEAQFKDVAKCRSQVARKLLMECETKTGYNSLIRAGYGGWLLYTAASAGEVGFVRELLGRDPCLVFGEGEYGVTDILYGAARSKSSDVFRLLLESSMSLRCSHSNGEELEGQTKDISWVYRWEIMNRAIHAAARGGNTEILRELLRNCSDVLAYRDAQGSTVLHTASGRGQVEVIKDLLASYDIINSKDNHGNTALNIAAYKGYLAVVELLVSASPSSTSLTNNYGDTFLHMAVAGFGTPGFRRLDRQIELMKHLVSGRSINVEDIVNVRNNDGRTALHMAVIHNVQTDLVELLMTVPAINLNIRDAKGMTPLDLLKQRPRSVSSELLIKQLISAGGISRVENLTARNGMSSHLKMQGVKGSPGTLFKVPDAEIFLYTGIGNAPEAISDPASRAPNTSISELNSLEYAAGSYSFDYRRPSSISNAAKGLQDLLPWPRRKERKFGCSKSGDDESLESYKKCGKVEVNPTPLRLRFSRVSSLPNNKRIVFLSNNLPSPSTKQKFAAGLMQGVIRAMPETSGPLLGSSGSSPASIDKQKGVGIGDEIAGPSSSNNSLSGEKSQTNLPQTSFNKRAMNQCLCFGTQDVAVEDSVSHTRPRQSRTGSG